MRAIPKVQYWRDPDMTGFEIGRIRDSRHVFPNHAHDDIYAIGLMYKGGAYCFGPRQSDGLVAPGQMALLNPGQVHSGVPVPDTDITYEMLYVDLALMQAAACDLHSGKDRHPEFERHIVSDPFLWHQLKRVSRLVAAGVSGLEKESALMEALAALPQDHTGIRTVVGPTAASPPGVIRTAKEMLAADLDRKIGLSAVAETVGLSRYHFLRVFKRETGLPPHLFRTQRRIEMARRLLRRGMPPAQVALETGFSDQSHFTNKFRQFTGATPRQYTAV